LFRSILDKKKICWKVDSGKSWDPILICPRGKENYGQCGFPDTIFFSLDLLHPL
jgi:hypothetical protein